MWDTSHGLGKKEERRGYLECQYSSCGISSQHGMEVPCDTPGGTPHGVGRVKGKGKGRVKGEGKRVGGKAHIAV